MLEIMVGPMLGIKIESILYLVGIMNEDKGQEGDLRRVRKIQRPHLDFQFWMSPETLL